MTPSTIGLTQGISTPNNESGKRRAGSGMRLIKMVGKVYRSASSTPQAHLEGQVRPNLIGFFDLMKFKQKINHLQETKLVGAQIAQQLELENKRMIEEARKKADFEAKAMMGNQSSSAMRHFSPDYHAALDCSTPSVYRNSIKLPFGTNTGFQDYIPSLNQLDNYEMTPSNFNHNYDRASQSSEVFTYGGSSAAPLFSEMFNPDLYEVEKVVDSNDQSPMGKSQSQMSELQFK